MSDNHQLGNVPIVEELRTQMNVLAAALDKLLNPELNFELPGLPRGSRKIGFILMVFPFEGHEGRCNYISSAQREDVIVLLKEQLAYFEGQPEVTGNA